MSGVRCQVSLVRCHVSDVMFFCLFLTKWWSLLVEGMLSMGPTPSSLQATMVLNAINEINI